MSKCSVCGKRGLFLKIDKDGRCSTCASKANRTLTAEELVERINPEFKKSKSDLEHQEKLLSSVWKAREQYKVDNDINKLIASVGVQQLSSAQTGILSPCVTCAI